MEDLSGYLNTYTKHGTHRIHMLETPRVGLIMQIGQLTCVEVTRGLKSWRESYKVSPIRRMVGNKLPTSTTTINMNNIKI